MRTIYTCMLLLFVWQASYCQQFPDRHNTSITSSWISCELNVSPNPIRGNSHWIQYTLDTTYQLSNSTFWNLNAYDHTDDGISDLVIDYSLDGIEWIELTTFSLKEAEAFSTYEGEEGPNFNDVIAKHILITSLGNFGGDCHGFSEFRVKSTPIRLSSTTDRSLSFSMNAQPNPFTNQTIIALNDLPQTGEISYQLSNLNGQVIQSGTVSSNQLIIKGENLAEGVYTLTLMHASGLKSLKLTHIK